MTSGAAFDAVLFDFRGTLFNVEDDPTWVRNAALSIGRPLTDEEFLARGIREGWLTPAEDPHGPLPPRRAPLMSLEELLREIAQDREDC